MRIQITRAKPARMFVGRAARAIMSETRDPESVEKPRSPWKTPFVAPLIAVGRKLGQPVGPIRATGLGMWSTMGPVPMTAGFVLGLQNPIQRQYWTGHGWSRPHAS